MSGRREHLIASAAPGMCFDVACQAAMDKAFLTATAIPLMGLAGAIAYKLRPLSWQKEDGKRVSLHILMQGFTYHTTSSYLIFKLSTGCT